jgi:hypothetical protein
MYASLVYLGGGLNKNTTQTFIDSRCALAPAGRQCPGFDTSGGKLSWNTTKSVVICNGDVKVAHVRNDLLIVPDVIGLHAPGLCYKGCGEQNTTKMYGTCCNFWPQLRNYDILVFNRGAHYRDDSTFRTQMENFGLLLNKSITPLQKVFYRTTAPAHGSPCGPSHKGKIERRAKLTSRE